MIQRFAATVSSFAAMLVCAGVAHAQSGAGDWTTTGFDSQRSFWMRSDPKISLASMRKPGFDLVWKLKTDVPAGQQSFLTPPVLLDFYIGYRGFRSLGFVGSSSGAVTGIDTDLGRLEWKKEFKIADAAAPGSSPLCPGGMTSGVARTSNVAYPSVTVARGFGRGSPAKSGVGEPFDGAVTLKPSPAKPPTPPPAPVPPGSAAATTRRPATPSNPFRPRVQYVYALSADGKFHSMYVSNGEEPKPPVSFLPPNANAQGLIVIDRTAYVSTANSCGGVENGLWALDLDAQKVSHWKSPGKGVAGSAGPAVGPDGTLYVAAGGELVALAAGTLEPKGSYAIGPQEFTSSPVVFEFKGKDLIAAASNDGRLHLVDTATFKALAKTPASASAGYTPGALASWHDAAGVRWILVPTPTAIASWKVVEQNGAATLEKGWTSREMVSPLTPIVVNGVVFAVSSGDGSSRAVLYALDGLDGKELWNSGDSMAGFVRRGGMAAGGSRIYVATQDGTQYAFGFPIEH